MTTIWRVIDAVTEWLSPARRRNLYRLAVAAGALLVGMGIVDPERSTTYVASAVAVVEGFALLLAAVKAKRGVMKAAYAFGAAALVLGKVAGMLTDGQESHLLELGGHLLVMAPLVLAMVRTDPATPTGEPTAEYQAKHGTHGIRA
jgi:hypothetical protein